MQAEQRFELDGEAPSGINGGRAVGVEFARWVLPRWKLVAEVFVVDRRTAKESKQLHAVGVNEFARWLHSIGFPGDGLAVAEEILVECQRQGPRWGLPPEDTTDQMGEPTMSMAQVQCYRRCCGAYTKAMLVNTMRYRRGMGSVTRSWRFDLDKDGDGQVSKEEFQRACHILCCTDDFGVLWHALRPGGGEEPLELWDLAPEEAAEFESFGALLLQAAQFDLNKAWRLLDTPGLGQVSFDQLRESAQTLGFKGDVVRLFKGMDGAGHGKIWPDALDFAMVLYFAAHLKGGGARRRAFLTASNSALLEKPSFGTLLLRLGLDSAGGHGTAMPNRELLQRLEKLGYHGIVARMAGRLVRALLKKRHEAAKPATADIGGEAKRPGWDASDVPHRARQMPIKYEGGPRWDPPAPRNNLFGATFLPMTI